MNISKEQIDNLNVVVSVEIGKEDYESKVNDVLRDYRRKANIPGFRPGKVPEGLVRKMYGKAVLIDEINKLVSTSLQDYIEEQEMHLLGDPLPTTQGDDMDWEIGNDFTFVFEMGLAPELNINLSKEDQLTKHQIIVDQNMIDTRVEHHFSRYGEFVNVDAVIGFDEKLTGDIVELDGDGQPLQNGLTAEDSTLLLSLIKDEERKKPFENAMTGNEIVFHLSETFPNEWEVVSILKKKDKKEVGDISASLFRFTVKLIEKYVKGEPNQKLYDKVFGEGTVNSLEEFENRIREEILEEFEGNSMIDFGNNVSSFILEKFDPPLPEEFLLKWLKSVNKKMSEEDIEKEFPGFLRGMKWEMISNAIVKQNEIKVSDQEIIDFAKRAKLQQFISYGISGIPDETLTGLAMDSLKDEKSVRETASRVIFEKVVAAVSELVTVNVQEVSLDEFRKLIYPEDEEVEAVEETEETEIVAEVSEIDENAKPEETSENIQ